MTSCQFNSYQSLSPNTGALSLSYIVQSCPGSGGGATTRSLEDDDDADGKEKQLRTEALLCAFETLGKTWPRTPQTQCMFFYYKLSSLEPLILFKDDGYISV